MRKILSISIMTALSFLLLSCGEDLTPDQRVVRMRHLMDEEKYEQALEHLVTLKKELPTDKATLFIGGRLYEKMGQIDSALSYAVKFTALFPADFEGQKFLYEISERAEDFELQLRAANRLGFLEKNRKKYLPKIAELNIKTGKPGMAVSIYRDLLADDPSNNQLRFSFAFSLGVVGKFDSAIVVMEELLAQNPGKMELMNNLAFFLAQAERFEEAKTQYTLVTKSFPDYLAGWHGLGTVLKQLGDTNQAIDAFQRVYNTNPAFMGVDSILRELRPE
ncbi:MAG: tetratricopeptide repeat protein [Candidatus Zixiibacteriota bacterium]